MEEGLYFYEAAFKSAYVSINESVEFAANVLSCFAESSFAFYDFASPFAEVTLDFSSFTSCVE